MSSIDIYKILASKQHNKHYLNRYYKFIISRSKKFNTYTESHHICPKAKDLFPEYASFKTFAWNKINLTAREHFIAHWLLYKAYKGSQVYAFMSMCNGQKSKFQNERYHKINSKTYEILRIENKQLISKNNKGYSTYYNRNNEKIRCKVDDPAVLSNEYTPIGKGKPINRVKRFHYSWEELKRKYPNKKVKLYFLDIKISVYHYSDLYIELIQQGWDRQITKEYKRSRAINANKNMSKESREKAAKKISLNRTGKKLGKNRQHCLFLRKREEEYYQEYYYDIIEKQFCKIDSFYKTDNLIKCFGRNNMKKFIWVNDSIKSYQYNPDIPLMENLIIGRL